MDRMAEEKEKELGRGWTSAFWLRTEHTECFDDITVYTVEVPVSEHKKVQVKEAKKMEIDNLKKYEVFEEVDDTGQ